MTTSFKQGISSAAEYLWSNAANWTNVVPVNGDAVTFNTGFGSNPSGYDDITGLSLDSLDVVNGFAAVGARSASAQSASARPSRACSATPTLAPQRRR